MRVWRGWIFGHSISLQSFYNNSRAMHKVLAQNGYNLKQDYFCLLYSNNCSLLLIGSDMTKILKDGYMFLQRFWLFTLSCNNDGTVGILCFHELS